MNDRSRILIFVFGIKKNTNEKIRDYVIVVGEAAVGGFFFVIVYSYTRTYF